MSHRTGEYRNYPDNCVYNKLIRDRVPEFLVDAGVEPVTRVLSDDKELFDALIAKVLEEAWELAEADSDHKMIELADVVEVIYAIEEHFPDFMDRVNDVRLSKRKARGGFTGRVFLVETKEIL